MGRFRKIRDWGLATIILFSVLGAGFLVWQWATNFHVLSISSQIPKNQSSNSVSSSLPASVDPGVTIPGIKAPEFHLTNQFGQLVSLSQFRHKVVVLSFIDSQCTTVCPLTAVVLRNLQYDLGSAASQVQLVAINANPVATSVQDVYDWSKAHNMLQAWQYATGTPDSLKKVWQSYYMGTSVIHGSLVQHTAGVYIIGPNGHERWVYLNASDASTIAIGAEVHDLLTHVVPLIPGHPPVVIPPERQLVYYPGKIGPSTSQSRAFTLPAIWPGGAKAPAAVGDGKGAKLVEFFATWCPDCQEETPTLEKLQEWAKNHPGFPTVVAVDLVMSESSPSSVQNYVLRQQLPFPVALDTNGKISDWYGVTGIPTQVLVSSTGQILWYHQGLINWNELQKHIQQSLQSR